MKFYNLINRVISNYIFPNMITRDKYIITKCVNQVVEAIDKHINLYTIYNQLSINSYKDIYIIVNMIIPFIDEVDKKNVKRLEEIPTKFTNLRYNLGNDYKFGSQDIIKTTNYLIQQTIPKTIHKLYVNWIDIYPDLSKNDGFHSKIKFVPKIQHQTNKDKIYLHVEQTIKANINKYNNATYFFLNSDKNPTTYKDTPLLTQFTNLKNNPTQNWFNSETFYWLSQIHFFNHFLASRVIYLTAGTGVGKSTHIPKLAMYALMAFEDIKEPKIIVTQPRQIPAQDVPEYISTHMGISIKEYKKLNEIDNVTNKQQPFYIQFQHGDGSHIESNKNTTHRTIKYVTDQLLFNAMMENPSLLDENGNTLYDIIMIDEAHEHNIRMDMILSLAKKTLQLNNQIRLMIISATMEDDEPRYRQFYNDIPELNIPMNLIDRRLHIANPLQKNKFKIKEFYEKTPVQDYIQSGIDKINYILKTSYSGDILFFLPGKKEINEVCEQLNKELPEYVITLPLYADLEEQRKKYAKDSAPKDILVSRDTILNPYLEQTAIVSPKYTRKIVIATDIAEASITIDTLVYVIDIGFSKSNIYDPIKKLSVLKSMPISMSSHTQRRGRAGRVADGEAYFLYTRDDIKDSKIMANIKISDLSNDIFQLLKSDPDSAGIEKTIIQDLEGSFHIIHPEDNHLDPSKKRSDNGLFETQLSEKDNIHINDAFEHLEELKLITTNGYYTDLGKFILTLKLLTKISLQDKIALTYSIQCNYIKYIIPIIAFTQYSKFKTFFTDPQKGLYIFGNPYGDHITILNIYFKYIKRFPDLFINYYSEQSNNLLSEDKKLKSNNKYFRRYRTNDITFIIQKELDIIQKWCKMNYINPIMLIKYLDTIVLFLYYKTEIDNLLTNYTLKKYSTNSSNINYNIIKLLRDSHPRNIGIVNNNGIYQTKYGVILNLQTLFLPETRTKMSLTTYKGYSNKIYFSNIQDFEESVVIEYISKC